MSYSLIIEIPQLPVNYAKQKQILRLPHLQADKMQIHQRSKYRKIWHDMVIAAVHDEGGPPPEPLKHAELVGIRYCMGEPPDRPNVWYSFKPLVDALTPPKIDKLLRLSGGCAVLEDDNPSVLVLENYYSVRVRNLDEQRIVLSIEESPG